MIDVQNPKDFILAGNATFTLLSENTNTHFTYKMVKSKDDENLYFIKLLRGPNNEEDYSYLGCYYKDSKYFNPAKQWKWLNKEAWPKSLQAIRYFLLNLDNIPPKLKVYHEGRCGRCGRKLTTPESIISGFGPECVKLC